MKLVSNGIPILWSLLFDEDEDKPEDWPIEDLEKLKSYHESYHQSLMDKHHDKNAEYNHHTAGGSHVLPSWSKIQRFSGMTSREEAAKSLRRSPITHKAYNRICDELDRRKKEDQNA